MGKLESVNNHHLTANFIVLSSTHNWVDGMKFIAHATIHVRKLAFQIAVKKGLKHPFNTAKQKAGK